MKILEAVQANFPQAIKHITPYRKIGKGVDGEVFLFKEKEDRVVKFGSLFLESSSLDIEVLNYNISFFIKHNPQAFVRVYEYVYLGNVYIDDKKVALYYSVMEKLNAITDDEKRVFNTLVSHQDSNKVKDLSPQVIDKLISYLEIGMDFEAHKVRQFCRTIDGNNIKHLDLHERNIMKDDQGNFKLIDLDRIQINQT